MAKTFDSLNRPLTDFRISVIDRCNFRCAYCMPADKFGEDYQFLPRRDLLTFDEITRIARIGVSLGVTKLRLTGGEPLLRPKLEDLVARLAALPDLDDLAITTNGYLLARAAQRLKDAGLMRVNVSLDSLDNAVFRRMNGDRADVETVLAGIRAAEAAGFAPIKINAVVQRGVNDHTLVDLAMFCREHGYIVRFIEYMDVGNINGWRLDEVVSAQEIVERIDAVVPLEPITGGDPSVVADRYQYRDGSGEIGVISSVTKPFCGDCTRLRLSPEGKLYTCLFGIAGTDLREPLRAGLPDEEITEIVRGTWVRRTDRYSEIRASAKPSSQHKVEMYHIGG